jgi:hypothetical protein
VSTTARAGQPALRFRLTSPAALLVVLGGFVLALIAAQWPLAGLARSSVDASTGGIPWWAFAPFGVVGFVIAWRKPRNALGWCLVGVTVAGALSDDGSFYAIAAYRIRHGTLPLGWVPCSPSPAGPSRSS